jgi:hypothetical protein
MDRGCGGVWEGVWEVLGVRVSSFGGDAGGEVPYEGSHPYPEEKTLAELQDRWTRHVSLCKECQQVQRTPSTRRQTVTAAVFPTGHVPLKRAASLAVLI